MFGKNCAEIISAPRPLLNQQNPRGKGEVLAQLKTIDHWGTTLENEKHSSYKNKKKTLKTKWGGDRKWGKCGSTKNGKIEYPPTKKDMCNIENQKGKMGGMREQKKSKIEQPPKMNGDTLQKNAAKNNK